MTAQPSGSQFHKIPWADFAMVLNLYLEHTWDRANHFDRTDETELPAMRSALGTTGDLVITGYE